MISANPRRFHNWNCGKSTKAVIVFDDNAVIVTNEYVNEVGPLAMYLPLVRR